VHNIVLCTSYFSGGVKVCTFLQFEFSDFRKGTSTYYIFKYLHTAGFNVALIMRPFGISRYRSFWTGSMRSSFLGFESHITSIVWKLHSRRYSEHVFLQPTRRMGASGPSQTLV